jgi:hypothetical protein
MNRMNRPRKELSAHTVDYTLAGKCRSIQLVCCLGNISAQKIMINIFIVATPGSYGQWHVRLQNRRLAYKTEPFGTRLPAPLIRTHGIGVKFLGVIAHGCFKREDAFVADHCGDKAITLRAHNFLFDWPRDHRGVALRFRHNDRLTAPGAV